MNQDVTSSGVEPQRWLGHHRQPSDDETGLLSSLRPAVASRGLEES